MIKYEKSYKLIFQRLKITNYYDLASRFTDQPEVSKSPTLIRIGKIQGPLGLVDVYFKHYQFPLKSWKFLFRNSKALCEYKNYAIFKRLEIKSAEPIACGEDRDWFGRLKKAFIITAAIPESLTMIDFWEKEILNRKEKRSIIDQIANACRCIHKQNFFHNDLFWRNIIVNRNEEKIPQVWWIDCPRGSFNLLIFIKYRKRIKDLASLDLSAAHLASKKDRLYFIKKYLNINKLDNNAKNIIRDVLRYKSKKWGEG